MSKNVKFNIEVDASPAKKTVNELSKDVSKLKDNIHSIGQEAKNLGIGASELGGKDNGKLDFATDKGSGSNDLNRVVSGLEKTTRQFDSTLSEFAKVLRTFKNSKDTENSKPKLVDSRGKELKAETINKTPSAPKEESGTPQSESPSKQNDLASILGNLTRAGGIGLFLKNYIGTGMREAAENESKSMSIYSRTGDYGSEFNKAIVDNKNIGIKYGLSASRTMDIQDSLMASGGFRNREKLAKDTDSVSRFSKVYGINPEYISDLFGENVKKGAFEQGQAEDYTSIIAKTIQATDMVGREDEQVRALNELVSIMSDGKINITSDDFKHLANLQTILGQNNEYLKGQKGTELISSFKNLGNPNDNIMLMLAGYGRQLGTGPEALLKAKQLNHEGIVNEEFMRNIMVNAPSMGMPVGSPQWTMYLSDKTGKSPKEVEEFTKAYLQGSREDALAKLNGNKTDELERNIQDSKALTREQYNVNKEHSRMVVGDTGNTLLSPLMNFYNNRSTATQVGLSAGMGIGAWTLGGKAISSAAKLFGNGFGGFNVSGTSTSIGGLSSLANVEGLTKIAPKLGIAGTALTAGAYGIGAYDKYKSGDIDGAKESIGTGAGTIGGGWAGAKAGAALGTMIAPGIGTVIGGFGGAIFGSAVGGRVGSGIASYKGSTAYATGIEENTDISKYQGREESILSKKEYLLKKEEEVFEIILGMHESSLLKDKNPKDYTRILEDIRQAVNKENLIDWSSSTGEGGEVSETGGGGAFGGSDTTDSSTTSSGGGTRGGDESSSPSTNIPSMEGYIPGEISARYESSGFNPAKISSGKGDMGGKSYGVPQFTSSKKSGASANSFVKWLNDNYPDLGKHFAGAGQAGTNSFDNAWRSAAKADHNGFLKAQQEYSYNNYTKPYIERIKKNKEIDLSRSPALMEMAISMSRQFGGGRLGERALGNVSADMSDEEIIKTSYAYKRNNVDSLFVSSPSWHGGLRKRFVNEEKDVLALLHSQANKLAIGTDKVKEDQVAFLHRDEAVLNKHDAKDYRERGLKDLKEEKDVSESQLALIDKLNNSAMAERARENLLNLNVNINTAQDGDKEIMAKFKAMIEQAIRQVTASNGVQLNRTYQRVPN